jgi:hypothetical protein
MRKFISLALLVLLCTTGSYAQQIVRGEYFFDTDPGFGSGTAFTFASGDLVNTLTNVPTTGLAPGFHHLFFRMKDAVGKWSHYEGRMFYVIEAGQAVADQPPLQRGEYFFDTDPGFGNGTAINFSSADSVNVTANIPVTGLAPGFHHLFVRVRNTVGKWSHYEGRLFYVIDAGQAIVDQPALLRGEYYFDTDPGFGNGTSFTFPTTDSVNMAVNITATGLSNGIHRVYLRVRNTAGKWSHYEGRQFEVCASLTPGVASIVAPNGTLDICEGQSNYYEVNVTNGGDQPTYQWTLNGTEVSDQYYYQTDTERQDGDELQLQVTSSLSCVSPSPMSTSLTLNVIDTVFSNEAVTICQGEFYQLPDGNTVDQDDIYYSYLSAMNSCDSVVITDLTVDVCVGLHQQAGDSFRAHPNPSDGPLTLQFGTAAQRSLMVMDATGKQVMHTTMVTDRHTIDLAPLAPGMYVLHVAEGEQVQRLKVIKR